MPADYQDLIKARVHYGHLARRWHPNMEPFIFGTRRGIHVIDLKKTKRCLEIACKELYNIAYSGKKIFFVGTKPQARSLVVEAARRLDMPYVRERWLGGLLTNFSTVRSSLRKLQSMEKMMKTPTYQSLSKKERLMMTRDRDKRLRLLGGIASINRLPAAVFVVDINVGKIPVAEANKLGIPVFAMVDTNADPQRIDYPIPSNDDSRDSIGYVVDRVVETVERALRNRKEDKEQGSEDGAPDAASAEVSSHDKPTMPPKEVSKAKATTSSGPQPSSKEGGTKPRRRRIGSTGGTRPESAEPQDSSARKKDEV